MTKKYTKKFLMAFAVLGALSLFAFSSGAQATDWSQIDETLLPGLDGHNWTEGDTSRDDSSFMMELVPEGQTVENWKEMITVQAYPGLQTHTTAKQMKDEFLAELKKYGATSKVISESPDCIIFEWRIAPPSKLAQYELDKIVVGKQAIHFLHYANKNPNPPQRTLWLKNFEAAHILHKSDL